MSQIKRIVVQIWHWKRTLYNIAKKKELAKAGKSFCVRKNFRIHNGRYINIGDNFLAMNGCRIEAWDEYKGDKFEPYIEIGDNVSMNFECHIGAINKIVIGNNVLFGSRVFITDHNHGLGTKEELKQAPNDRRLYSKGPVIVEDNVWIGEGAVILPNVRIGEGSIIGANAVVTKNVEPYSKVVGNPAKVISNVKNNKESKIC